ncbi:MAG: toprim domain-containing protein [Chitinophagaceae bacterium]|nr:toprim domain-containing protein [Chitinophagaceae bacterium]
MTIPEIKQQLTLAQVLQYYNLKPDKSLRLHCPFHDDKTPSLQVYYKTHTCYCFSSNCKTHGKSLDVIDFILHKENCTKHEAILKAVEMIGYYEGKIKHRHTSVNNETAKLTISRQQFLHNMFTYFKNAIHNSKPAQEYLQSRCIDFKKTEVGYNAGQFHHGARKDEAMIKQCLQYGLLLDLGLTGRTGDTAYKPFGKWCICFALRNQQNEIVSLYFRSTLSDKEQRHFYLRDRQGLYPNYPKAETRKLILTESIIDAATLLEQDSIKSNYEVLALFGTNGLTEEHTVAVSRLKELEEIIFFLDGDEAGNKAVAKYAPMLKSAYPKVNITNIDVPQGEDVNSLLQGHSPDILAHLITTRKAFDFFLSNEPTENKKEEARLPDWQATPFIEGETLQVPIQNKDDCLQTTQAASVATATIQPNTTGLDTNNPYNLQYQGTQALYQIKGFRVEQMDSLKITLQIILNA